MAKKISEMTLAELQDYAYELEVEQKKLNESINDFGNKIDELHKTNLALQTRNNKLFMQLEAQSNEPAKADPTPDPEEDIESCEDFASKNLKEIMK